MEFERYGPFEAVWQPWSEHKPREIARNSQGAWKIVWERTSPVPVEDTMWVDEAKGFTITRREMRDGQGVPASAAPRDPAEVCEVNWKFEDGVWVPATLKLQTGSAPRLRIYDLSFEWKSINRPIPDRPFTMDGLDITDRKTVIDRTSGQPVVRGVLNDSQR
jgi:hypothetical protein